MMPPCWRPSSVEGESSSSSNANGRVDGLLWYKDSGEHVAGEFSMAVIQANNQLEDTSQLESGPLSLFETGPHGTFVGIYDGHGGPTILVHKINPEDQFLIFASDGLWEHLSNQEAVDIVNTCPRNGIARKLVKAALREAAKKREMRYSDLKKIDRGVRRHFHDDITVVVLFIDFNLVNRSYWHGPAVSIHGGDGVAGHDIS
ncbi:hypothetical protein V6N13_038245 [Hibiscus sabdariffa]|uniref:protein-serine/threonine phosphatase n=1 Tax=Hibiscus sabdariffa TaxID=183260 RepID=A0ABR2S2I9_9ROSI